MAADRFIGMKCPNCAKVHANTLAHLEAHWQDIFACEYCGLKMAVNHGTALAAVNDASESDQIIIEMTEANQAGD